MSAFDFSANVLEFSNTEPIEVAVEAPPSSWSLGEPVGGGWTIVEIGFGAIWPLNAKELELVSEAARERGAVRIYVTDGIDSRFTAPSRGMVLAWTDGLYQVTEVFDWRSSGGFVEATAVKMDVPYRNLADFVASDYANPGGA